MAWHKEVAALAATAMVPADPGPVHVIAVTGGKGGVGKTNTCTNIGIALSQRGHDVMLLDADLGLANVEVLLGLRSEHNLSHVLKGDASIEDIIITGPAGIQIVPGASGIARMANLSVAEQAGLVQAFSEIPGSIDYLLIDTAAGITSDVINFTRAAQEVVVVVCDEPTSITDAYALIKILSRDHAVERFHIVANMVANEQEGRELYNKMSTVTDRFLDVVLQYLGTIPEDEYVRRAVRKQQAVTDVFPRSRSATGFSRLAAAIEAWPRPGLISGHLEFFMERLVQVRSDKPL
jgi:flagellar biosynthesis protein FlhG